MAQEEFDPLDLMSRVAMLILEARTPHQSAKGRVEGPHCPGSSQQQGQHHCSQESFECLRASEFRQRLNHMWRNGIPSCIDVVLYPDCLHGRREAQSLEMAGASVQEEDLGPSLQENCLLLEHWNIQCTKKRHGEWTQGVAGSMLLQAIRSYLYFSQLSSWLASMRGCIPNCVACRLYAPGEEGGVEFTQHPESHIFPSAVFGPHGVKVSVLSLPRQLIFPIVLCILSPQGEWAAGSGGRVDKVAGRGDDDDDDDRWSSQRTRAKLAASRSDKAAKLTAPRSPPAGFKPPAAPDKVARTRPPDTARTGQGQRARKAGIPGDSTTTTPSPSGVTTPSKVSAEGQGGQPEEGRSRSSAREVLEGQLRPLELTGPPARPQVGLHSPKVLMSEGIIHTAPLVTRKKRLDLSGVGGGGGGHPAYQPPLADDLQWLMKTTASPLSPLDMHQFLTNLHALTAPIPAARCTTTTTPTPFPPHSTLAAAYHRLKAVDDAAAPGCPVGVLLPGPELQQHHQQGLARPSADDQRGARFRKRKALPYGGDARVPPPPPPPPQAPKSSSSPRQPGEAFAGSPGLLVKKNLLPFFSPSSSAADASTRARADDAAAASTREALSPEKEEEARTGDADSSRPPPEMTVPSTAGVRRREGKQEDASSEPVADRESTPTPALFPHSTQHHHHQQQQALSDSISRTLRDLSKIVWASEAKPAAPKPSSSLSLWPGPVAAAVAGEAIPASSASASSPPSSPSSSSSSSSTYSSSPVVSAGGSSTPTNLSCSPVAEDGGLSCPPSVHSGSHHQPPSPPLDSRQQSSSSSCAPSSPTTSIGNAGIVATSAGNAGIVATSAGNAGIVATSTVNTGTPAPSTVNTGTLAPSTVNTGTPATSIVNTGTLAPSTVNTGTLAPSTVNTGTLAPSTVNTGTLAPSTVNTGASSTSTVSTGTSFTSTVNTGTLAPSAVNTGTLAPSAVNTGTSFTSTVNTGTLAPSAVNTGTSFTSTVNTGTSFTSTANTGTSSTSAANTGTSSTSAVNTGTPSASTVNTGTSSTSAVKAESADSATCLPAASPAWQDHSATPQTPQDSGSSEALTAATSSVKRRLDLVGPGTPTRRPHRAKDSAEGTDAGGDEAVVSVVVGGEAGRPGISLSEAQQHQQQVEEGSRASDGSKEGRSPPQILSLGCSETPPPPLSWKPAAPHHHHHHHRRRRNARLPDQSAPEACDDTVRGGDDDEEEDGDDDVGGGDGDDDDDDEDDTRCMFYLESPPSPEPPREGRRPAEVQNEAWLVSSFAALRVVSSEEQSSGQPQRHRETQPVVTNGFAPAADVVVGQDRPNFVAFVGKDESEDVIKSSGRLGQGARGTNLSFEPPSSHKQPPGGRAVSGFRNDSFINCSWDVKRDVEPADDGLPSFAPDFSPVVSGNQGGGGDDVTPPSPPPSSPPPQLSPPSLAKSSSSATAKSKSKSALATSLLAQASPAEQFSHSRPSSTSSGSGGPASHRYDSSVDIHAPYFSHGRQVLLGSGSAPPPSPPFSPAKSGELDGDVSPTSSSPGEEDSVFYDAASAADSEARDDRGPCPTRTKSAPSFAALSADKACGLGHDAGDKAGQEEREGEEVEVVVPRGRSAFKDKDGKMANQERLRSRLVKSASLMFSSRGSLPSQSSPAPVKRRSTGRFDYDETLTTTKAIKSAISLSRLTDVSKETSAPLSGTGRVLSTSAPASTNCLLGNFEESILNGRLEPAGVVDGFSVEIGASGSFCPRHLSLPVTAYFFNLSDDNAPSPYLGHINLEGAGKRGYRIPNKGTLQVTLFNPNRTVVKMFVVRYDLGDMPPNCQTIIRQRTVYVPSDPASDLPSYLRYLIHLRVVSSSGGKVYLHTDVRLIFARNKFELDSTVAEYELRSFTETPANPKYSPKR